MVKGVKLIVVIKLAIVIVYTDSHKTIANSVNFNLTPSTNLYNHDLAKRA